MFEKWFKADTPKKSLGKIVKGAATAAGLGAVVAYDLLQKRSGILRNYPVIGHGRTLLLKIRPQIQQYFIERDWAGRPFDKTSRELIYSRARDDKKEESFGTVHDVTAEGKEWFVHSITPVKPLSVPPRISVGGADCTKPYDMALLNVSSMSYGSLSANAIQAL